MKSAGLFEWISKNQPDENHEFAHGWWRSMEFLQLLSHDFESFEFDVISSFSMETPPPTSTIPMPLVSACVPNLEIIFKESWVLEPNYTVSVKWGFAESLSISTVMFWSILELIARINGCSEIFRAISFMSVTTKALPLSQGRLKISTFSTPYFIFCILRQGWQARKF